MATIPIICNKFFPEEQTEEFLEMRFIKDLRLLRCGFFGQSRYGAELIEANISALQMTTIHKPDRIKVNKRVEKLIARRQEASEMRHLLRDERKRLHALADGVRLAEVQTEHRADEIAAALHDEMPWMASATEQVWRGMRSSVRDGAPGLRLPPILLDGPPGIGKSFWARRLGRLLTVPTTVIEANYLLFTETASLHRLSPC